MLVTANKRLDKNIFYQLIRFMPASAKESIQSTILIFLKAPRSGHVKTRLAKSIGLEAALRVYRSLVERQLREFCSGDRLEIHYSPVDALEEMSNWLGDEYAFYPQCEGGLGIRLENAVANAFTRAAESVICIGGDCPQLNRIHLEQTAAALHGNYDSVFGPSEDGGYYLIGLNAPCAELFRDIPWSTGDTLKTSLKKSSLLNLRVKLLETLYDVDETAELSRAIEDGLLSRSNLIAGG